MDAIGPDDPTAPVGGPSETPGTPGTPETPAGPPDVAQLIAEREALAAEVERLSHQRVSRHRFRKIIAGLLVAVFALTFIASGVGIWLHRNTLNSDVWNDRVVPLGQDPAVQAALAAWTTDELMQAVNPEAVLRENLPDRARILAVPLSAAIEDFVGEQVDKFYASDAFEEVWTIAATRAHDAAIATLRGDNPAITTDDEKVTINFIPLINEVLARILEEAPGLVGSDAKLPTITVDDVPSEAREKLGDALGVNLDDDFGTFTIYDDGKLQHRPAGHPHLRQGRRALDDPGHRLVRRCPGRLGPPPADPAPARRRGRGRVHPHPADRVHAPRRRGQRGEGGREPACCRGGRGHVRRTRSPTVRRRRCGSSASSW